MEVALVLYPHFTMLDIVGPFQVLGDMSECEIRWVASSPAMFSTTRPTPDSSPPPPWLRYRTVARPILADSLSDDAVAAVVADVRGSG